MLGGVSWKGFSTQCTNKRVFCNFKNIIQDRYFDAFIQTEIHLIYIFFGSAKNCNISYTPASDTKNRFIIKTSTMK